MKKLFTSVCLCFIAVTGWCQTPITITGADMVWANLYHIRSLPMVILPASGPNQTWDYSSIAAGTASTYSYPAETIPFFTSAGVDVTYTTTKEMSFGGIASLVYDLNEEWDFNSGGFTAAGIHIPYQVTDLTFFPGFTTADSLGLDDQQILFSTPVQYLKTPFTANSAWRSVTPVTVNLWITMVSNGFNLHHAPLQHRYTNYVSDTVIGWGKLSVYTGTGHSIPYDVLMVRSDMHTVDSFFVNGSPDSTRVMDSLYLAQAQEDPGLHAINFYTNGNFRYLMRFTFDDSVHTNLTGVYVRTDGLINVGVEEVNTQAYSSLVYPNPVAGNEINVQIVGKNISNGTYTMTDMAGRVIMSGTPITKSNGLMQVPVDMQLPNGKYIVIVTSGNDIVVTEQVDIKR